MRTETGSTDFVAFRHNQKQTHNALLELGKAVDAQGLDKDLSELVKLRVSQVNGCAFCTQLHLDMARKLGVAQAKLDLVAAWKDAQVFSARERAAFAFAETLTRSQTRLQPDQTVLQPHFSPTEAELLVITIATINAWNRIAMALHFPPMQM